MRLSFVLSVLAACLFGAALSAPTIYTNSVTGNSFTLYDYAGTVYDAQFHTRSLQYQPFVNTPATALSSAQPAPMSTPYITLALAWAGDRQDTYTFATPAGLTVAAVEGSSDKCAVATQTTLNEQVAECVYKLSWAAPFSGTFSVVYVNSSFPVGSATVAMTFIDK